MSYTINKTDGSVLAIIPDGTINNDFSISIVGRNYGSYGEFLNEANIRLLENGANDTPPTNPLKGELWFDSSTGIMKLFNGQIFKNLGNISISDTQPSTNVALGDLWFDEIGKKLYIYGGPLEGFLFVGPNATFVHGSTIEAEHAVDGSGNPHTYLKHEVDNNIVAITSADAEYTPVPAIPGFTTVKPGIQLATFVNGQNPLFEGTARRALNVVDGSGNDINVQAALDTKVSLLGDTMTGSLILNADPTLNLEAATKQYVDAVDTAKVNKAGDTMTGPLLLYADPLNLLDAATKQYVDAVDTAKVNKAGDTMTGSLILDADPTSNLEAATKQYVDTEVSSIGSDPSKVDNTGDTLTGVYSFDTGMFLNEGAGNINNGPDIRFTGSSVLATEDTVHINIDYNNDGSGDFIIAKGSSSWPATILFTVTNNGLLRSSITNYENLVTSDNDIPNKKYVDDAVTGANGVISIQNGLNVLGSTTVENFTVSASQTVDIGNNIISNVADPINDQDVATKSYIDNRIIDLGSY